MSARVRIEPGDCLEVMARLAAEGVRVDAVVTDPPYHLTSITKRFGKPGSAPAKSNGATGVYARAAAGFMGQQWDGGDIAFRPETWRLAFDLLPPGGWLLAFGGTRTYHRMGCAIEDAGFDVRDQIGWLYGQGFPKSLDVSKAIDKAAGAEREVVGENQPFHDGRQRRPRPSRGENVYGDYAAASPGLPVTAPATEDAKRWAGWGTSLKPAWEPIIVARKPLDGTVVETVLAHGTGAFNIDGCRIHAADAHGGEYVVKRLKPGATLNRTGGNWRPEEGGRDYHGEMKAGRYPANVVHDGSDEVEATFAQFGESKSVGGRIGKKAQGAVTNVPAGKYEASDPGFGDTGSASRFFFSAKAGPDDRFGSKHPTVKPVALMRWLIRLVTRPGGTVLDPFAGSGTTGVAALAEGMSAILIEREQRWLADIRARLEWWEAEGRHSSALRARNENATAALPLFADTLTPALSRKAGEGGEA